MPPSPAVTLDSLSLFPSLAYVRNYQTVFSATLTHDVYLAWQQGGGSSGIGPFIFFKPINLRFTPGQKPTVGTGSAIEHVTRGLPGCQFYHPCIAADTLRVAVAFDSPQRMYWRFDPASVGIPPHVVTLRFRDSVTTTGQILRRWNTPAYTWGKWGKTLLYPSVVQFPSVPKTTLRSTILGGLTWYSPDSDDLLYLYRYGDGGVDTSLRGAHPSMTRSPHTQGADAWSTSGILKRSRDADGFDNASPFGYDAEYFTAELINTPTIPSALFTADGARTGGIFSHFVLSKLDSSLLENCEIPSVIGGIYDPRGKWNDGLIDPFDGASTLVATMGPQFFGEPDLGATIVDAVDQVGAIARTGEFPAIDGGVTVMWGLQRNDELIDLLNDAPYDMFLDDSATILVRVQLLRASDDALLWEGTPVNVRSLTLEPLGYTTNIPADSIAGTDTLCYARLSVYVSPEVELEVSTGYQFIDKPDTYFPKRLVDANGDEGEMMSFAVAVYPNPTRGEYSRVLVNSSYGDAPVSLSLYDLAGNRVADLGTMTLRSGEGSGSLEVGRLRPGVYVLSASQGSRTASTRVTVVR